MPLGFERLNAKRSQPNGNINFIKPLEGDDKAIAQDFLERIAAQCVPVMKEHHIYVMSLEEFPPNREFVGRNFNAGEVIQLVLKSPVSSQVASSTGRWLPFNYVQMVMMHELAHCKQMNHSRAFWAVRNKYADQMRTLWSRKYTGEGLWGRGTLLESGRFEENSILADDALPEHLCGGTYRTAGRKRKQKQKLSYQEQKERRILKKFGSNGIALGEDEDIKTELENGKKPKGKPRVAKSKRGRELRAAAALARFDQARKTEEVKEEDETASEFETVSDDDDDDSNSSIVDNDGRRMIKVCEDEDPTDGDAQNEMRELSSAARIKRERSESPIFIKPEKEETTLKDIKPRTSGGAERKISVVHAPDKARIESSLANLKPKSERTCPICSFKNTYESTICGACSHVLAPGKVAFWRCKSKECQGSLYLNPKDSVICGGCGKRKEPAI
ncbi:WLM-domain-containing protein [Poronia punctata]|nr:WLM-domain-containing protein [Poronia punctata]